MPAASTFPDFIGAIVRRDADLVARQLTKDPSLATMAYGGDTALHMAAAAFCRPIAERHAAIEAMLVDRGGAD